MEYERSLENDGVDNWFERRGVTVETRRNIAVAAAGLVMSVAAAIGIYESVTTPDEHPQCDRNSVSIDC